MSRKVYILNIIVIFIYLWVIGTLPLHHHDHKAQENVEHQCDHHHENEHTEEDCIICFNLFIPQAIDQIDIIEQVVFSAKYKAIYNNLNLPSWHNIIVKLLSNKDPPFSFIS